MVRVQVGAHLAVMGSTSSVEPVVAHADEDLGSDDVHVWVLDPATVDDPTLAACADLVLVASERAEMTRFRTPQDRRAHVLGRALARCALSRYGCVKSPDWRIVRNAHGRPELAGAERDLHFNVAHADGLVACALTLGREIGIDVERHTRELDPLTIARDAFAPGEVAALVDAGIGQRSLFFDLWTLKEAYVKARGQGLQLALDTFAFRCDGARLAFDQHESGSDGWQFALLHPTTEHSLAVATRTQRTVRLAVRTARLSITT